jgi:hypothetical protein
MRSASRVRAWLASSAGHSLGGLLLRYALGSLYCPTTGRIAGLRPCHFISLATPHMGCDAQGLAQVRWPSCAQRALGPCWTQAVPCS